MRDLLFVSACVIVGVLIGVTAMIPRVDCARDQFRKDAIMRGFAEYVMDEKGDPTWQWKEAK